MYAQGKEQNGKLDRDAGNINALKEIQLGSPPKEKPRKQNYTISASGMRRRGPAGARIIRLADSEIRC
jgi:hypothetical protein